VHSQRQAWFKRDCAHGCETKIQIKTACKKLERAFACPWHGPHGKELSAQQLAVTNTISSIPGVGRVAVEQYCVLDIAQKPVDIVLRDHGLIIEVDGLQHEHHAAGFGEEAGQQFSRDREFDRKVLQSGRRLLRLSVRDRQAWANHVHAAIRKVQQQPQHGFVYYSHSYEDSSRL
jgi:hypothetical protein